MKVQLKNGSKVNKAHVSSIIEILKYLNSSGDLGESAVTNLIKKAEDPSHVIAIPSDIFFLLKGYSLMEGDGGIHDITRDIILSIVKKSYKLDIALLQSSSDPNVIKIREALNSLQDDSLSNLLIKNDLIKKAINPDYIVQPHRYLSPFIDAEGTMSETTRNALLSVFKEVYEIDDSILYKSKIIQNLSEREKTHTLSKAVEVGDVEIVQLLLDDKTSPNNLLFAAAKNGHTNIIKMLLAGGADINEIDKHYPPETALEGLLSIIRTQVHSGNTRLSKSATNNILNGAKALVENGINLEQPGSFILKHPGEDLLRIALNEDRLDVAGALLNRGVDPYTMNQNLASHEAGKKIDLRIFTEEYIGRLIKENIDTGKVEAIENLIQTFGDKLLTRDKKGELLDYAVNNNKPEAAAVMIMKGFKPEGILDYWADTFATPEQISENIGGEVEKACKVLRGKMQEAAGPERTWVEYFLGKSPKKPENTR